MKPCFLEEKLFMKALGKFASILLTELIGEIIKKPMGSRVLIKFIPQPNSITFPNVRKTLWQEAKLFLPMFKIALIKALKEKKELKSMITPF